MDLTWRQRLAKWWCETFGHRARRDAEGTEVCLRCNRLLSTAYSRSRACR